MDSDQGFCAVLGFVIEIEQEFVHLIGPMSPPVDQSLEFPEDMCPTNSVANIGEREIGVPAVMNEPVCKLGQEGRFTFQSLFAAFGMDKQMGQLL